MAQLARMLISLACFCISLAPTSRATGPTLKLTDFHFPIEPGYKIVKAVAQIDGKTIPFACGLFVPPAYFKTHDSLPLIITLHTRGNSGSDGNGGLVGEGLGLLIASGGPDPRGTGDKPNHPLNLPRDAQFVGLVPQCSAGVGWDDPQVAKIVAMFIGQIARTGRIDQDRVYLTGFSYGGSSTWRMAMQIPECFAAIAPLDARATPDPRNDVKKLTGLPIYLGVGGDDGDFILESVRMRDALIAQHQPGLIYHIIPGGNHWSYGCVYTDPEFYQWLFAQRRSVRKPATRLATTQPTKPPNAPVK